MKTSKKILRLMTLALVAGMFHFGAMQAASTTLPRSRSLDSLKNHRKKATQPIMVFNSTSQSVLVCYEVNSGYNSMIIRPISVKARMCSMLPYYAKSAKIYQAHVIDMHPHLIPGGIIIIGGKEMPLLPYEYKGTF